jgi:hypothetical protein
MAVTYSASDAHAGEGMSAGLARGLVVLHDGDDITGEGMGIGAVAARTGGFTYFGVPTCTRIVGRRVAKHFRIDRRLVWTLWGRPSMLLTRLGARSTGAFMSRPLLQRTLMHVRILAFVKRLLGLGIALEQVPPVASARVLYAIDGRGVRVAARLAASSHATTVFYVMNELSADAFGAAVKAGRRVRVPSSWEPLDPAGDSPSFCCEARALRFTFGGAQATPGVPVRSFWGREHAPGINWAGFELELEVSGQPRDVKVRYDVAVLETEARR